MAETTTSSDVWECTICCDDKANEEPIVIDDDKICQECADTELTQLFQAALANEFEPARWGRLILDPNDFRTIVDRDFLAKWNAAKKEREVPLGQRVYCRNKATLGSIAKEVADSQPTGDNDTNAVNVTEHEVPDPNDASAECGAFVCRKTDAGTPLVKKCAKCQGRVCSGCSTSLAQDDYHEACKAEDPSAADDPFAGLTLGRHYQICPKCGVCTERSDGCNHMTCSFCSEHYCFLCGKQNLGNSGHWRRDVSACPLYNHPGDDNAWFEPNPRVDVLPLPLVSIQERRLRSRSDWNERQIQKFQKLDIPLTEAIFANEEVPRYVRAAIKIARWEYFHTIDVDDHLVFPDRGGPLDRQLATHAADLLLNVYRLLCVDLLLLNGDMSLDSLRWLYHKHTMLHYKLSEFFRRMSPEDYRRLHDDTREVVAVALIRRPLTRRQLINRDPSGHRLRRLGRAIRGVFKR